LKAAGENVGPAIVPIRGAAVAVGDGVAESNDCGGIGWGLHIDLGDLIPVVDVLGFSEYRSAAEIAVKVVRSGAGAGVSGLARGR